MITQFLLEYNLNFYQKTDLLPLYPLSTEELIKKCHQFLLEYCILCFFEWSDLYTRGVSRDEYWNNLLQRFEETFRREN